VREIKFRGISLKTSQWIYGDLVHAPVLAGGKLGLIGIKRDGCYPEEVRIMSVGQLTGLKDENGKDIFEGDVVKCFDAVYTCKHNEHRCEFAWYYGTTCDNKTYIYPIGDVRKGVEVIGNIHENKEG